MKDWQDDKDSVEAEATTLLTDFHPPTSGYPFAGCTSAEHASVFCPTQTGHQINDCGSVTAATLTPTPRQQLLGKSSGVALAAAKQRRKRFMITK